MNPIKMSEQINDNRRRFFGTAAMTLAAAQLGMLDFANAQPASPQQAQVPTTQPGTNTSFGSLKQINAGLLNIGYAEAGPARWPRGHSSPWLALRHSQFCRRRSFVGFGRLQGNRSLSARLRYDALSFR